MALTIYRSSAGSGKTYTLVLHFLQVVLHNPAEFRRILGITFTNKAAAELKQRIISCLAILAEMPGYENPGSKKMLMESLRINGMDMPEAHVQQRAFHSLRLILHNYSDFSISTIDSFMHRVVSTFTFDMHISHDFGVELDTAPLIEDATGELLGRAGREDSITYILENALTDMVEDERGWDIEKVLDKNAENCFKEDARLPLEALAKINPGQIIRFTRQHHQNAVRLGQSIQNWAKQAWKLIESAGLNVDSFLYRDKGVGAWIRNLAIDGAEGARLEMNSYQSAALNDNKWFPAKIENEIVVAFSDIAPQVTTCMRQIRKAAPEYHLSTIFAENGHALALLTAVDRCIEEVKRNNNVLHISDFNQLIRRVVISEPAPYVFSRLGVRYRHFLLDEFQDTSVTQWHNLVPLLASSLAGNENDNARNLIVGDGKQSIYRWRNSELETFESLPAIFQCPAGQGFEDAQRLFAHFAVSRNLPFNYRSFREIVDFNNLFFNAYAQSLSPRGQKVYAALNQELMHDRSGGYVYWEFVQSDDNRGNPPFADKVLETLKDLKEEGFSWSDIAILVRRNSSATVIAEALTVAGINVVSSESLLLKNAPSVRILVAWLRLVARPDDPICLMETIVLCRHILGLEPEAIADVITDFSADGLSRKLLGVPLMVLAGRPLFVMCEDIMNACRLNDPPDAFCQFFLDKVLAFTGKGLHSVSSFLREWDLNGDKWAIQTPEEADAVRIMTIHKAKGLEFRVVIYPYFGQRENGQKDIWVSLDAEDAPPWFQMPVSSKLEETSFGAAYREIREKEALDLANLNYVAFTRAIERLYILSYPTPKTKNSESLTALAGRILSSSFGMDISQTSLWYPAKPSDGKKVKPGSLKHADAVVLNTFLSSPWENRMAISRVAPDGWKAHEPDQMRDYGKKVHHMLSQLTASSPVSGTHLAELFQNQPPIESVDAIRDRLKLLEGHRYYQEVFGKAGEVFAEGELLLPTGRSLRPDRVVAGEAFTIVVDYKTGQPGPAHTAQVSGYMKALEEAGYPDVSGYLVYLTETPDIVKVST